MSPESHDEATGALPIATLQLWDGHPLVDIHLPRHLCIPVRNFIFYRPGDDGGVDKKAQQLRCPSADRTTDPTNTNLGKTRLTAWTAATEARRVTAAKDFMAKEGQAQGADGLFRVGEDDEERERKDEPGRSKGGLVNFGV